MERHSIRSFSAFSSCPCRVVRGGVTRGKAHKVAAKRTRWQQSAQGGTKWQQGAHGAHAKRTGKCTRAARVVQVPPRHLRARERGEVVESLPDAVRLARVVLGADGERARVELLRLGVVLALVELDVAQQVERVGHLRVLVA
eukprot:1619366-Prymnesium_polylepis.1